MDGEKIAAELVEAARELVGSRTAGLSRADVDRVYEVLDEVITRRGTGWKEIVRAVKASGVKVGNWLDVRGVLQWMMNEGEIERTPDIRTETYVKI